MNEQDKTAMYCNSCFHNRVCIYKQYIYTLQQNLSVKVINKCSNYNSIKQSSNIKVQKEIRDDVKYDYLEREKKAAEIYKTKKKNNKKIYSCDICHKDTETIHVCNKCGKKYCPQCTGVSLYEDGVFKKYCKECDDLDDNFVPVDHDDGSGIL